MLFLLTWSCAQAADREGGVRLYYGARTPEDAAYLDRFSAWEKMGVQVIPVYSQLGQGYVQVGSKPRTIVFQQ